MFFRPRRSQLLDAEVRLVPVRRPHLKRGSPVHFALTDVMELDPDAARDLMGGLGLQHLLVVLLGVPGEAVVVDGRAGLQQERIEDRRLASAVWADEYDEPRSCG